MKNLAAISLVALLSAHAALGCLLHHFSECNSTNCPSNSVSETVENSCCCNHTSGKGGLATELPIFQQKDRNSDLPHSPLHRCEKDSCRVARTETPPKAPALVDSDGLVSRPFLIVGPGPIHQTDHALPDVRSLALRRQRAPGVWLL